MEWSFFLFYFVETGKMQNSEKHGNGNELETGFELEHSSSVKQRELE